MPPSLCYGVGSELGLLILMSWLKDGPVILESLGSELGLFLLLQDIGVSRWAPFSFAVC